VKFSSFVILSERCASRRIPDFSARALRKSLRWRIRGPRLADSLGMTEEKASTKRWSRFAQKFTNSQDDGKKNIRALTSRVLRHGRRAVEQHPGAKLTSWGADSY
jgi:hypothetical protein